MADIGDKSFTTEMVQEIKKAVIAELGTNAFVNRYLATVSAINTTTSEITVSLSGSDQTSAGFRARGLQLPAVGDQVIACIDGQDRWIESVVRPQTATPYLQISSGAIVGAGAPTGSIIIWSMPGNIPPAGWLACNGQLVSRTTYAGLFAVIGTSYGVGDGSTTFKIPDLQGKFIGANAAHTSQPGVNSGAWGPNSTFPNPSHTHSTPIGHTHSENTHSHTTTNNNIAAAVNVVALANPTNVTSGRPDANLSYVTLTTSGSVAALGGSSTGHRHTTDIYHDHTTNGVGTGATTATGNAVFGSGITQVTQAIASTVKATSDTGETYSWTAPTAASFLANFIIKT